MRIIITLLMAMSLLLNSSCGKTANLQTDEHSGSETENITTQETIVTRESESTTADAETAAVSTTAEPETSADIPETTTQESTQNETDPESEWLMNEPPLSEAELAESVPDFLDEDQQLLYRRAKNVYEHFFGCVTFFSEYLETMRSTQTQNDVYSYDDENGYYLYSRGRYKNWDDFMRLMRSVFTEDFFLKKNRKDIYIEDNGRLVFHSLGKGGVQYYNDNFQDEFELLSKSDDEIVFDVIGHYSQIHPYANESYEERDRRVKKGWELTDRFTVRMVNTESGWRFDEFYSAATDERAEELSEVLDVQVSAPEKDNSDALTFMLALRDDVDEYNYLYFGIGFKEVKVPITEHELYVLMVNGVLIPEAVIIEDGVIWIPADELHNISVMDQEQVEFYNSIPYIPLDTPELMAVYSIETVSMYKSDYMGYSLSAIMLESETSEPTYTVDEARDIVGSLVREMYMKALTLLDSDEENELNEILSADGMERVRRDAESLTIKDLTPFGRYYRFNTSAIGTGIYFDRYTGRIFSDAPITQNFTLFIHGGIYSIGEAYW